MFLWLKVQIKKGLPEELLHWIVRLLVPKDPQDIHHLNYIRVVKLWSIERPELIWFGINFTKYITYNIIICTYYYYEIRVIQLTMLHSQIEPWVEYEFITNSECVSSAIFIFGQVQQHITHVHSLVMSSNLDHTQHWIVSFWI